MLKQSAQLSQLLAHWRDLHLEQRRRELASQEHVPDQLLALHIDPVTAFASEQLFQTQRDIGQKKFC